MNNFFCSFLNVVSFQQQTHSVYVNFLINKLNLYLELDPPKHFLYFRAIVNAPGEIMIQGDVVDEVIELIQEQFKISEDVIEDIGDIKPAASDKKDKKDKDDAPLKDGEVPVKKSAGPRPQGNPRKK